MAKPKITYTCQSCGFQSPKWLGKCPDCNQWNSLLEEKVERALNPRGNLSLGTKEDPAPIPDISTAEEGRVLSGIAEFECIPRRVRFHRDLGAFGELAVEDLHRERVFDHSLNHALERSRAVVGVVASLAQQVPRAIADLDFESLLSQSGA